MSPKEHQLTASARQHVAATQPSVALTAGLVAAWSRKPWAESQCPASSSCGNKRGAVQG
jgi:hypothetical protein